MSWAEAEKKPRNYMSHFSRLKKQLERHTLNSLEPRPLLWRPTVLSFMKLLVKFFRKFLQEGGIRYIIIGITAHIQRTVAVTLRVPGCQQLVNIYKSRDQPLGIEIHLDFLTLPFFCILIKRMTSTHNLAFPHWNQLFLLLTVLESSGKSRAKSAKNLEI